MKQMIGNSEAIKDVFEAIGRFAGLDVSVLIVGESGTGKGLAARALHDEGPRAGAPFLRVHCATLSIAADDQTGASPLEGAPPIGGTLFLDEVGDLTADAQLRLMALLERAEMTDRDGGPAARIVAATRSDLAGLVKRGDFREDLHYRLHGATLAMPPLRERREDIPALARHFLQRAADRSGAGVKGLSAGVEAVLLACPWPGNVRQLKNIMDEAAAVSEGAVVALADLPAGFPMEGPLDVRPRTEKPGGDAVTRERVLEALAATKWHKSHAAALLGIGRTTFYRKIKEMNI